MYEEMATI